jgi:hypothetical protein
MNKNREAADRMDVNYNSTHGNGEHVIQLNFWDDSGAETFDTWWWAHGQDIFREFCQEDDSL